MASNRRLPESPPVPPPVGQGALQRHSFSARAARGAGVGERGPEKQEVARDPGRPAPPSAAPVSVSQAQPGSSFD